MSYSQFSTLRKATSAFGLTLQERSFLPVIPGISPSKGLLDFLEETLPSAASGSEKLRSEAIIYPILIEVRRILDRQISIFSGEDFTVDELRGLNGIVDFLISRSPVMLTIQAPAAVIVEAKKADITTGLGQCVAEMVAAQFFNQEQNAPIDIIYGIVTNGMQWRFLMLEEKLITIDLMDYQLRPIDQLLAYLIWMVSAPTIDLNPLP
jgi:hypothetical protein